MKNKLENILNEKGIKITWLANKTELHRNSITRIIDGTVPSLENAFKISKALGLSIYDIWDLE